MLPFNLEAQNSLELRQYKCPSLYFPAGAGKGRRSHITTNCWVLSLRVRHCSKHVTHINPFNPATTPICWVLLARLL